MFKITHIPELRITKNDSLSIDEFRKMDNLAVEEFNLPIELMMENAGLQLARMVAAYATKKDRILIGVGSGNNGGGGLVAARRLAGWGFSVNLHIPQEPLKPLVYSQLRRALAFGAQEGFLNNADIFIDAYLGFSQRLPLSKNYLKAVVTADMLTAWKISLDIPSGFDKNSGVLKFRPDVILTLAVPKKELLDADIQAEQYLTDIGFPAELYQSFGVQQPEFALSSILKLSK